MVVSGGYAMVFRLGVFVTGNALGGIFLLFLEALIYFAHGT